jgi:hypothetical protein
MGHNESRPLNSFELMQHIATYINTIAAMYPRDNIPISDKQFDTLRKNLTNFSKMDYKRLNRDEIRTSLCNSIRCYIALLYMANIEQELTRASKNIKLAADGELDSIQVLHNSRATINEFVINSIHRSISVLLPPKPVHIALERYNQMIGIIINCLSNIRNQTRKVDDNDKAAIDKILDNFATLRPVLDSGGDINFEKNIYTPLAELFSKIKSINNNVLHNYILHPCTFKMSITKYRTGVKIRLLHMKFV